jgi:hypothetical protein
LVVIAALGSAWLSFWAQTSERALLKRDFPILTERVKVSEPSDYVIALDKSLSMKRFWPQVMSSLSSFVGSIPDGDYVSILAFGDSAGYLVTPAPMGPQTRVQIQSALKALPGPTDYKTDLGAGVSKVLDELYRPGGNRLKFVFFLTDFEADPPSGSPYRNADSPDSAPWKKLVARRRDELSNKILDVQAFVLNLGEPGVGRNLNLVQAVFPEMQWQRIDTPAAVAAWFQRRQAEIARSKLRAIVRHDLERAPFVPVGLKSSSSLFEDEDRLALLTQATPGIADLDGVEGMQVRLSLEGAIHGADFSASPRVATWRGKGSPLVLGTLSWSSHPWLASEVTGRAALHLEGHWRAEPADEIRRLDLDPNVPFTLEATLPLRCKHGKLPLWLAGLALAVLLVLGGGCAYRYRAARLNGQLTIVGHQQRVITPGEKLTELSVGAVRAGEGVAVPGATWLFTIRAFRTGEAKGIPRGTYARAILGAVSVQATGALPQPLGNSWTSLPKGAVIEAGGIRMIWS